MGLGDGGGKTGGGSGVAGKKGSRLFIVLVALGLLLAFIAFVILGVVFYLYFSGGSGGADSSVEATTTVAQASASGAGEAGPGGGGLLSPVTRLLSSITGEVECSGDEACYHETARKCEKSETTYQTLQATQLRRVLGEKDGKCEIYFENIDINRELTTEKWLGLNMTCLLDPADTGKNILTEVPNPSCSGSMWDALKPYVGK